MDTDRQADKHKQTDGQTQADSISETCHELAMKRDLLAGRAPSTDTQTSANPTPMRAVTDDAIDNFQLCSKHWHIAASFATHYLKQAKSKTYNLTFPDLCGTFWYAVARCSAAMLPHPRTRRALFTM